MRNCRGLCRGSGGGGRRRERERFGREEGEEGRDLVRKGVKAGREREKMERGDGETKRGEMEERK